MVAGAEAFAKTQAGRLAARPITGIRILASGCNLATADYGTAKFLKLVPLPITADDIEEFAHRQFWSTPADDLVIYIAANPSAARTAAGSAAALESMGMRTHRDRHTVMPGSRPPAPASPCPISAKRCRRC